MQKNDLGLLAKMDIVGILCTQVQFDVFLVFEIITRIILCKNRIWIYILCFFLFWNFYILYKLNIAGNSVYGALHVNLFCIGLIFGVQVHTGHTHKH